MNKPRIVNPGALAKQNRRIVRASRLAENGDVTSVVAKTRDECMVEYIDFHVCHNGETDVAAGPCNNHDTTQIYWGCYSWENDCADNDGNPDDPCCWGSSYLGPGDNIDHMNCRTHDAAHGDHCFLTDWPGECGEEDCCYPA